MNTRKYIKSKRLTQFRWNNIEVVTQKDFIDKDISIKEVLAAVEKKVPNHLFRGLDAIYVGEFDFLKERDLDALYKDGAIFISNAKDSLEDVADDLTHELAHLVEKEYGSFLYSDRMVEREFIEKRKNLYFLLKEEGYEVSLPYFLESKYNPAFDQFLYQEVGYSALSIMTINLFYSPYGTTSLREYFANCFEGFFWDRNTVRVKDLSPEVYKKLNSLLYDEEIINEY